jgi:hypothetical protein
VVCALMVVVERASIWVWARTPMPAALIAPICDALRLAIAVVVCALMVVVERALICAGERLEIGTVI